MKWNKTIEMLLLCSALLSTIMSTVPVSAANTEPAHSFHSIFIGRSSVSKAAAIAQAQTKQEEYEKQWNVTCKNDQIDIYSSKDIHIVLIRAWCGST